MGQRKQRKQKQLAKHVPYMHIVDDNNTKFYHPDETLVVNETCSLPHELKFMVSSKVKITKGLQFARYGFVLKQLSASVWNVRLDNGKFCSFSESDMKLISDDLYYDIIGDCD